MAFRLSYQWMCDEAWKSGSTGISLHSHTSVSKESVGILFEHGARNPLIAWLIRRENDRYFRKSGKPLDFNRAYWTSPVTPSEAYGLECRQIEELLRMQPLVSITDHDAIEANLKLRVRDGDDEIPISTEWTVPVRNTFFHLGIHNLPPVMADEYHQAMQEFRTAPSFDALREILTALRTHPEVLIVLNHPMWDEAGIGQSAHKAALSGFLHETRGMIDALELNGLRTWAENQRVMMLAETAGLPLVSGGDRHGHEPNALLNVTRAATFSEFVEEIRGGESHVIAMPQYRESRKLRCLQTAWDMIRDHPGHPQGKVSCLDRSYLIRDNGERASLATQFNGETPAVLRGVLWGVKLLESPQLRSALRVALSDGEGMPS
ncbi:MAG: hypothetical protein LC114_19650 [Bryobacterales bacterium]|nr:hypothetical protein [Bryobacterales bacterium]